MPRLQRDTPIQFIKGVGPKRAELFAAAGIATLADLLEFFPFRYEPEPTEAAIEELRPGQVATVRGEVIRLKGDPGKVRTAILHDGTDALSLRWFGQPGATRDVVLGATIIATGDVQEFNGRLEIVHPKMHIIAPGADAPTSAEGGAAWSGGPRRPPAPGASGKLRQVGIYRSCGPLKGALIRRVMLHVLAEPDLPVEEVIPEPLLKKHALLSRQAAIRAMHAHFRAAELDEARRRLVYEEFFLMETALAVRRHRTLATQHGRKLTVTPEIDTRIRRRFPFKLTASQDQVIAEIRHDLASGRPMTRLLQGDVGSGKTVVALYAALAAISHGCQAAIMAPTEILAQQHFDKIEQYLADSRVRRTLLRGGQARVARARSLTAIDAGEIDLVVGTQALLERDVAFANLAMVIIDEQHKFGVMQRAGIRTKGPAPHYLVMTATPIPRTLSMTVFGDLDVSIIRHAPPGRGRITTRIVPRAKWGVVMDYVRKRLESGDRAYVVCPLVGKGDSPDANEPADPASPGGAPGVAERIDADAGGRPGSRAAALASAIATRDKLADGPWRGLSVGLLHGAMKSTEKQRVMSEFAGGAMHAVVATSVIEVGVDVSHATVMIVEHADRFGLSQLHQLRGRIGRGQRDSLCVLLSDAPHPESLSAKRLAVLAATTDGFKIAEADLEFRGPGELFGTKQHGLPELRIGNLVTDFRMLDLARQDAFDLVRTDPQLREAAHARMIPALRQMFGERLMLIDVA